MEDPVSVTHKKAPPSESNENTQFSFQSGTEMKEDSEQNEVQKSTFENDANQEGEPSESTKMKLTEMIQSIPKVTPLRRCSNASATFLSSGCLPSLPSIDWDGGGVSSGPLSPDSMIKWIKLEFKRRDPKPRCNHVSAFINDKMVIFGGYSESKKDDHIHLIDTSLVPTFLTVHSVISKTLNEDLSKEPLQGFHPLEVQSISSMESNHATYRVGHCGVGNVFGDELYLFGGWNGRRYINHGLRFNVNTLELVEEQPSNRVLPPPRRDHTLCSMGSCFLLFGGWSHQYNGNELWLLTPNSGWEWMRLETFGTRPCSRRGHSANVVGYDMFVFGGLFGSTKYLNDLHVFNGEERRWRHPQIMGPNRPSPRAWHSSNVVHDSQIIIYGGCSGRGEFLNDIWVFDTVGFFWFQIECQGPSPLPRCGHSMVAILEEFDEVQGDKSDIMRKGKRDRLRLMMFGGMVSVQNTSNGKMEDKACVEDEGKEPNKGKDTKPVYHRVKSSDSKKSSDSNRDDKSKSARNRRKRKRKKKKKNQMKRRDSRRWSKPQETDDNAASNKIAAVKAPVSANRPTTGPTMNHMSNVVLSDDIYMLTLRM